MKRSATLALALILLHGSAGAAGPAPAWDTTKPRGKPRNIDFVTREGTWMSVDPSPDGRFVVFDLLGHIYRVPMAGGAAQCLTQDSGIAVNLQPRYSPDGKTIAFVGSHREVRIAASAMGPMQALEVASLHGARALGAERDLGSIAVGKVADLMVLDSNPLDDIRNTQDIRYVMKAGFLYDGFTLDQIWPERRPFGEPYWVDPDALRDDDRPVDWWDRPARP